MRKGLWVAVAVGVLVAGSGWNGKAEQFEGVMMLDASEWERSGGWPVVPMAMVQGESVAVNVHRAERGYFLDDDAQPEVQPNPAGGYDVVYSNTAYRLVDRYEPWPELGDTAWRRRIHFKNTGEEVIDIDHAHMRIQAHSIADAWEPSTFRMVRLHDGRLLCASFWSEGDDYGYGLDGDTIMIRVNAAWRLEPGDEAVIGRMGIWVAAGTEEDAYRVEAQRWYRAQGIEEPLTYPEWFREGILYEASAAGHIDSRFSDVGGFRNFAHQVPYLADLGISVMWLNAVQEHKIPPNPVDGGWNHYDPRDLMTVDPIVGGDEGLRYLAKVFDAHGIHLLNEIVPHGGNSVQARALEEWWTRDRHGEPVHPWGGYGIDNASPEWQQVLSDSMAMLAEGFGIQGARIDVIDGQGNNWGSPRTNHASYSTVGAGVEIIEAVRDGIRQGPERLPVILPESIKNRPEYLAVEDASVAGYGFDLERLLLHGLGFDVSESVRLRETLTDFFECERGALPEGALVLRTLNNHDTVCEGGRVQMRFGAGLARALYGICLSVPGVPMMYQEEELGSFMALRRMNWIRRSLSPLIYGDEHYVDLFFAPEVFTVLRSHDDQHVLALSNLSGQRIASSVAIPDGIELADGAMVHDPISGMSAPVQNGRIQWALPPYGTAFLCLGFDPKIALPPIRFEGEAVKPAEDLLTEQPGHWTTLFADGIIAEFGVDGIDWDIWEEANGFVAHSPKGQVEVYDDGDGIVVYCVLEPEAFEQVPTLRIYNADAWYVAGRTALLHDWFIRRHYPFPEDTNYVWERHHSWGPITSHQLYDGVAPSGRMWQSLLEPLHPEAAGMAFSYRDGKTVFVEDIETDASNIVLTNCADEADPEPLRLEVRFYAMDPDLHPQVRQFGVDPPWRVEGELAESPRSLSVTFRIREREEAVHEVFHHDALPFIGDSAHFEYVADRATQIGSFMLLPNPGYLTWSNLPSVEGPHRIGFMLRHSESDPARNEMADKYIVEVNGEEQRLEWTDLDVHRHGNAYLGLAWTPPLYLENGPNTVRVTTSAEWCGVGRELRLRPEP